MITLLVPHQPPHKHRMTLTLSIIKPLPSPTQCNPTKSQQDPPPVPSEPKATLYLPRQKQGTVTFSIRTRDPGQAKEGVQ